MDGYERKRENCFAVPGSAFADCFFTGISDSYRCVSGRRLRRTISLCLHLCGFFCISSYKLWGSVKLFAGRIDSCKCFEELSDLPDGDPTPYTSNATMWELGTGMNKDNPAPTILADTVVLKGGIINEADPGSSGVVDLTKVFLGMVRFGPGTGGIIPTAPTLSLTYAEGDGTGPYKNFVQYVGGADPGVVLDGSINFLPVNVSTTPRDIVELGDANGDGFVNSTDYVAVRNFLTSPNPPARADANRDGLVNSTDYVAVRNKL